MRQRTASTICIPLNVPKFKETWSLLVGDRKLNKNKHMARYGTVRRPRHTCDTPAIHRDTPAIHLRYTCDTLAIHLRYTCDTPAIHLRHTCDFQEPSCPCAHQDKQRQSREHLRYTKIYQKKHLHQELPEFSDISSIIRVLSAIPPYGLAHSPNKVEFLDAEKKRPC